MFIYHFTPANKLRLLLASLFISFSATASEITLTANDGFKLKANYYQSEKDTHRAAILLHQCNYNRTMYDNIGQQLAAKGIHAISLDFRGFGDSTNDIFDVAKILKLPTEQRGKAFRDMSVHWPTDVQLVHDFVVDKTKGNTVLGVIGASCGGSQAIRLSEKNAVSAIGFFSSAQSDENVERYTKLLAEKPTLIIAAEEDGNTYTSAQKLFKAASNANSKLVSYKGNEHGYPLLDRDAHLATAIVNWLDSQL